MSIPYSRTCIILFFSFLFFNLTYSRCTSSLLSCLWSQRIFPSLPGSRLTIFLSRCKFSTLTTRQPMVKFYLLAFPRFPLRKKKPKSYFGKNRTHDFRTSRCADYLLDHSGDEGLRENHYHCSTWDFVRVILFFCRVILYGRLCPLICRIFKNDFVSWGCTPVPMYVSPLNTTL